MSGALFGTLASAGSGIGSVGTTSAMSVVWNDIYGEDAGSTEAIVPAGLTAPIQISATRTGLGVLSIILNGAYASYTGPFLLYPGDSLAWAVALSGSMDRSGVVTVTNASAGTPLGTFNYIVYSSRGSRA